MRNYAIKIGFRTNNAVEAAALLSEVVDAVTFDIETKAHIQTVVIVPDEFITEADLAADKDFDESVSDAYSLERMMNINDDEA